MILNVWYYPPFMKLFCGWGSIEITGSGNQTCAGSLLGCCLLYIAEELQQLVIVGVHNAS